MIFKRRDKPSWKSRLREMLFPRKGWRRGIDYIGLRIRRIPDTPHKISIGLAAGTFMVFSPLFGLHILLAGFIAYLLRGNILAAFIATWFGNPVTYPFVVTGSMKVGLLVLGRSPARHAKGETLMRAFEDFMGALWSIVKSWFGFGEAHTEGLSNFFFNIFLPYLLGGAILGAVAATAMYFLTRPLIGAYQTRRREKMAALRRARLDAAAQTDETPNA